MGDRDDHPGGRGGHHGGGRGDHEGGRGGHHGGGGGGEDGGKREELRDDLTQIHHDRKALREADTPEERKKAQEKLDAGEKDLKQDWGPGMPKGAGEAHHGGGHGGGDEHGEHKHGGHGKRDDN